MVTEIEPWLKYPDLTQSRLTTLANVIRRVRSGCVELHKPEDGDGNWSLGCRVYERTFFAIRELSKSVDWVIINPELKSLQFSFCVGSVPLRFYKGDANDPPSRYLTHSDGELMQLQTCFEFEGLPTVDTILRLAVEVDSTRQAVSVSLVEIDEYKEVIGTYRIPFDAQGGANLSTMQTPPVNLPPVVAEPLKKETDQRKIKGNSANGIAS